jgi:hypothetical protein
VSSEICKLFVNVFNAALSSQNQFVMPSLPWFSFVSFVVSGLVLNGFC